MGWDFWIAALMPQHAVGQLLGKPAEAGREGCTLPCPAWPGKFDAFRWGCLGACQDGFEQTFLQGGKLLSGCWRKFEGRKLSG